MHLTPYSRLRILEVRVAVYPETDSASPTYSRRSAAMSGWFFAGFASRSTQPRRLLEQWPTEGHFEPDGRAARVRRNDLELAAEAFGAPAHARKPMSGLGHLQINALAVVADRQHQPAAFDFQINRRFGTAGMAEEV